RYRRGKYLLLPSLPQPLHKTLRQINQRRCLRDPIFVLHRHGSRLWEEDARRWNKSAPVPDHHKTRETWWRTFPQEYFRKAGDSRVLTMLRWKLPHPGRQALYRLDIALLQPWFLAKLECLPECRHVQRS